jgi:Ca2+-binding RTX toxin-like protein
LILQTFTPTIGIQVGGIGSPSTLDITDTDLAALSSGFSSITIGRSNSSGTITINTSNFTSPVTFRTPNGQININSTLGGDLNFIASGITINNGKSLTLGKSEEIINTANLTFNGATFSLNGFSETLNKLTVSSNSAINFGNGNNILAFSSSSSQTWIGILTINNWTNSKTLKFGTNSTGLATSQLSKIQFNGFNTGAEINSLGFVTPLAIRGNGILIGTSKNDIIIGGAGNDSLTGGSQNDVLTGGLGNDSLNGDAGIDTVKESGNVNFTLTNTSLTGLGTDILTSIETANLTGGVSNNTLSAVAFTLGSVTLNGDAGNDLLIGGSQNDFLNGGDGNDTLAGKAGNDTVNGGNGIDIVTERADVNFTLTNTNLFGLGTDTLTSIESAVLTGGVGNNSFNALAFTLGSVTQNGDAGNDVLRGGFKNDFLSGGDGNDVLRGAGNNNGVGSIDTLTGNAGNDTFILSSSAIAFYNDGNNANAGLGDYALIKDFSSTFDKIQLEGAANLYVLGSSPIAGVAGTAIYLDTNGNKAFNSTDELIAVVQGSGGLSLASSYFSYV